MANWEAPKENSVEALQHGMEFADGVEFDLRVDGDGEFVIYHDEFIPGSEPIIDRCIERLSTEELRSSGVTTFEDLLSNKVFTESWQSGGKTVDIEIKIPHPMTNIPTDSHLSSMMERLEEDLSGLELPKRSAIVSSFSPRIGPVSRSSGVSLPVTRLVPHIRAWGRYWRVKRAVAMPNFARTSVQGITKSHRREGMEAIGMALEYLVGWTKWINPTFPVGLHGRGLQRFHESRQGMGAFVWPAPIRYEEALIDAGVSLVSDDLDPTVAEKPDGSLRWPRPASQPLDQEWRARIGRAPKSEWGDLIEEASSSLPMWPEISKSRLSSIIGEQARRMLWPGNAEKWVRISEDGIPWGSPRLLGHRGAGKTHSS
ncbi:MAG: hypothetical protein CMA88_00560 [Euryarchaeota archaeon]|nr:hypothetical protein [Euryarchaeota archaeon]